MGRSPCCDKVGLKKGPWTPEEDQKLLAYIEEHGHGNWRALPSKAGLQRCGKSCRLRWTNYLRPDIKRGKFSLQEEQTIIQLHALLGNRWSAIATHLPKRTDNEIKNYWNTHLKKRLTKMGIDPITHKPKNDALLSNDGQTNKNASNLSHMAQWESARLEAEARLVRQSKLIPTAVSNTTATVPHHQILLLNNTNNMLHGNSATNNPSSATAAQTPRCLDQNPVLRAWHGSGTYPKTSSTSHDHPNNSGVGASGGGGAAAAAAVGPPHAIESPTSTLSFSENGAPINNPGAAAGPRTGAAAGAAGMIEFMADSTNTNSNNDTTAEDGGLIKEEGSQELEWKTTFGNNNISSTHHQLAPPPDDHYSDVVENSLYSSGLHDMTLPAVIETPTWAASATPTRAAAAAADGHCIGDNNNNNNNHHHSVGNFIENFTELLLSNSVDTSLSNSDGTAAAAGVGVGGAPHDDDGGVNRGGDAGGSGVSSGDFYEDNKNYWNSILNLVNSSPSSSPLF